MSKTEFWPLDIPPNFFCPPWNLSCASLSEIGRLTWELPTTKKRTAAEARVAWPHRGTSVIGVNHLNENFFPALKTSPSWCVTSSSGNGRTKAVSERFISIANFCFVSSGMSSFSKQTAAGLPPVKEIVRLEKYNYLFNKTGVRPVSWQQLLTLECFKLFCWNA